MKNLNKFLVLIIGLSAFTTVAQNADSVIVIYDNQKTIIPLPAFGSQTSVSYADTNKVVEIGIWLRKPGETSPFSQLYLNDETSEKSKHKSKWFSQIQAGYSLEFTKSNGERIYEYDLDTIHYYNSEKYSLNNGNGYKLILSVYEKENRINKKYTFTSGFNFGYEQYFFKAKSYLTKIESGGQIISQDSIFNIKKINFDMLYHFGISYHFKIIKIPSRINLGNRLGFTTNNVKIGELSLIGGRFYITLVQPYLGLEIGKMGVLFSADFHAPDVQNLPYPLLRYAPESTIELRGNVTFSFTYRIF